MSRADQSGARGSGSEARPTHEQRRLTQSAPVSVELTKAARGNVVFNHLEALDHCPTTRTGLRERMTAEGLSDRTHIPEDGEEVCFERRAASARPRLGPSRAERPGMQKWITAPFAGA